METKVRQRYIVWGKGGVGFAVWRCMGKEETRDLIVCVVLGGEFLEPPSNLYIP